MLSEPFQRRIGNVSQGDLVEIQPAKQMS